MSAGMQDLYQAMNMFSDSLSGFAKQTAVLNANQKVQDIKDQFGQKQISDQEQQKQLGQVAQGVTAQLTGLGMPVSDIQNFVGGFKPRTDFGNIQTPFEGELAGITDPAKIRDLSAKRADQVHQEKMAEIQAKNSWRNQPPPTDASGDPLPDNKTINALSNLRKQVDPATASSRSLYGRMGGQLQKLQETGQGLLAGDPKALTNFNLNEAAQAFSSIFGGGAATVSGSHALMPRSMNADLANLKGYVTNNIEPANAPGIGKAFQEIGQRLQPIVEAQIRSNQKNTLRSELANAAKGGKYFSAISEGLVKNPDGTPETAKIVDGKIRFASDDKIDRLDDYANKILQNPTNPQAQQAFEAIKADPYYPQAMMERPQFQQKMKKSFEMAFGRDVYKGDPLEMKDNK